MFRVVVQDSRRAPNSGKVVARLGSYDPHAKALTIDKEKAAYYMEHGAQPSDRAAYLLKSEGVKLPSWVKEPAKRERSVRNPDKRRSTAPEQPAEETAESAPAESAAAAEAAEPAARAEEPAQTEAPAAETAEPVADEAETAEEAEDPEASADDSAEKAA